MKFLKYFESGGKKYNKFLYYTSSIDNIINENWHDIKVTKHSGRNIYIIHFESDKYFNSVVIQKGDEYYIEETAVSKFTEKLKKEFLKKPEVYVKNFKYDPKVLGDLNMYRQSKKFNL